MRISSLFTASAQASSTVGTAVVLLGLTLTPTAAQAQSNRTSEAGEAAITDPTAECTNYVYPPVATQLSTFPPIWQPATLLANDTAGQAKWSSIQSSIPTTSPKGTLAGDFSSFTPTYSPSDPDCWWTYNKCVTPKLASLQPDISSVPEPLTLGYGFDDGPNCSHNAFYDYLSEQKQKATMFYVGSNVMDWPLEAQRALTDGHEICVHTWSHHYMTAFSSEDAFAELWYTLNAIKLVVGVTPTCWRPPFGDVDDRIRAIAAGLGLRTILWQFDSNDWQVGSATAITPADVDSNYQSLIAHAANGTFANQGAIILTHELNNFTMSEAIKWLPQLQKTFTGGIMPVGVAMNMTQPYVEKNYSLPSYTQYKGGELAATQSAGSTESGNSADGAFSMHVARGGLVGALAVTAAFLGGAARILL
ncbi:carbohydrate esterase family 4 protein [Athelia psychrophila]|uniref:chitin deacetylase n=1 Tax=Athelia psychrophila TaxID=1759441 RepID=A0A166PAG6_9AGAM|nr:carbohydrate esterase family 4 protein [Fibularhizoctonia sp. CBS 109695]